jgi:hypothetical protein
VGGPISPACNRFPADGSGLLARMLGGLEMERAFPQWLREMEGHLPIRCAVVAESSR